MKAIVYHEYGPPDVLKLEEVEKPAPGDDEVLIRVRAASINPADRLFEGPSYIVRALLTGLLRPKPAKIRVGTDVAGVVESVGRNVTTCRPGDAVFGCSRGALAEFCCPAALRLATKPENASFEEAAVCGVAGLTALQCLRDHGRLQPGQRVLVNGAAGGVGTFAVQIGKALGAHVTGVCSTPNMEMVRSIGADRVIDYTGEDFTRGAERYDLILDCMSNHALSACRHVMTRNGILIIIGGPKKMSSILALAIKAPVYSRLVSQRFAMMLAKVREEDLNTLRDLMASGKLRPVVGRRFALNDVPEAFRYLGEGHARGKIGITVA